jgi:hypothetical protein
MPKKYRVEMSLVEEEDDGTTSTVESETVADYGTNEQAARDGFETKKNAAKGQG